MRRTGRTRTAVLIPLCLLAALTGLTGCGTPREPAVSLSPADTLKAAQLLLTDRCLTRQGLTPPRPGERPARVADAERVDRALFGTGRAELTLKLPSGHVIGHHTDGCLAAAERRLYGDQGRWFRAVTRVNNLKSKAPSRDRAAYRELRAHALTEARALLSAETRAGTKAGTSSNKS
ncbi:hypothetical protein [Streptomyces sp. NPDC059063]|uniref:hypothetical protein n=1 Tax=unclassified Streptomyces TaxID=2593676 RepID=UPI00369D6C70